MATSPRQRLILRLLAMPKYRLTGAGAIWHGGSGYGQYRAEPIGIADVKQHSLGHNTTHLARLQVDDEQGLLALDVERVSAFVLETHHNRARVVAEANAELHQLIGARHVLHRLNPSDADVNPVYNLHRNAGLHWSNGHKAHFALTVF